MTVTLYRWLTLLPTLAFLAIAPWRADAGTCPFTQREQTKTHEILLDGYEAFRSTGNLQGVAREIGRSSPIVITLLTRSLTQIMSSLNVSPGPDALRFEALLKNVHDGGRNLTISRVEFPSAPELGVIYKVQIGYLEATAASSPSPDAFSERLAVLYYRRVGLLKPFVGGTNTVSDEFVLLGSTLDGQTKSCFIQ